MTITVNDMFSTFNRVIQSGSFYDDLDNKLDAINRGNLYLAREMYLQNLRPGELFVSKYAIETKADQNYVTLPDNFMILDSIAVRNSSGSYDPLDETVLFEFNQFQREQGSTFYDTTNTGYPDSMGLLEPYIYLDKYISSTEAHASGLYLNYYRLPTTVTLYHTLTVTITSGTAYTVGETVSSTSDAATATVLAIGTGTVNIDLTTLVGDFYVGDTLTGGTSATVGTITAISENACPLDWLKNRDLLIPEAWAVMYFELIGSGEVQEKDNHVKQLITQLKDTRKDGYFKPKTQY